MLAAVTSFQVALERVFGRERDADTEDAIIVHDLQGRRPLLGIYIALCQQPTRRQSGQLLR
jgi:hypothetical protein